MTHNTVNSNRTSHACLIFKVAFIFYFQIYFAFSAILILTSLFALIASTHPSFQRPLTIKQWKEYWGEEWPDVRYYFLPASEPESEPEAESTVTPNPSTTGGTTQSGTSEPEAEGEGEPEAEGEEEPLALPENAYSIFSWLTLIELTCTGLFMVDLCARYIFCPKRKQLLVSFLHWVDVFALVVTVLKFSLEEVFPREKYEASFLDMLHCLQIVRVFRLFRLVKNSIGFRVLLYAFKASFKEMTLMSMFLVVAMLIFSTCVYFSGDDNFTNIPDAFWWAVVTMTTVGYGDVVPKTAISKTIGAVCAVSGVCLLAVVIPIFVNNFMLFYSYSKIWGDTSYPKDTNLENLNPREGKVVKVKY